MQKWCRRSKTEVGTCSASGQSSWRYTLQPYLSSQRSACIPTNLMIAAFEVLESQTPVLTERAVGTRWRSCTQGDTHTQGRTIALMYSPGTEAYGLARTVHVPDPGEKGEHIMYEHEKREIKKKRKMRKKQHRWMKIVSKTGRVTHSKPSLFLGGILFGLIIPVLLCLLTKWLFKGDVHLYIFHSPDDSAAVTFFQNYMIFASYCILFHMTGSLLAPFICMFLLLLLSLVIFYPLEAFATGWLYDLVE